VTSQHRAAASAADPGNQKQSGNGEEMEEHVLESAGRVANLASPVTEAVGSCPDNEGGDGDDVQNDDEAASAAKRATKRMREDSSEQGCGSNVASICNSPLRVHVQSMFDTLRPYTLDMVDDTRDVNLWLAFLCLMFEDGNNFRAEASQLEYVGYGVV